MQMAHGPDPAAARPNPPRAGPARQRSRARGFKPASAGPHVSEMEGGLRHADVVTTQAAGRRNSGEAKSHDSARHNSIPHGYGPNSSRAT